MQPVHRRIARFLLEVGAMYALVCLFREAEWPWPKLGWVALCYVPFIAALYTYGDEK
jgi:hypothetical protein